MRASGCAHSLRGLAARGLSGVQLVTSDCHHGLRDAIAASWQRCRAHYARNLATKVPKSAQPWVATLVRTIFEQPGAASVRAQHLQVVTALEAGRVSPSGATGTVEDIHTPQRHARQDPGCRLKGPDAAGRQFRLARSRP